MEAQLTEFMAKLTIKTGGQAGREIELKEGLNRIGRNPDNDITIPEPSISSFHCEVQVAEIGTSIRDLNSTNGTFINQKQIAKGMLQKGDLLTLGDIDFVVELEDVHIAMPEIHFELAASAAFLEDGTPACFTHRELAATFRCSKCENWWCNDCVRLLKRLNGEFLKFCPECDGPCVPMTRETGPLKKSFFGRLGDTLKINRKSK
ncbi:MAG: FHA domain-containing protein [Limisphaerales bacterium]